MRRFCSGIAGVVLAFTLAGCGETTTEGPLESKPMDTDAINKLRENMSANAKGGKYKERPTETKPADTKSTDKK
jgi:hypothetical protein